MKKCPDCHGTMIRERTTAGLNRAECAYCPRVVLTDDSGTVVDAPPPSPVITQARRRRINGLPCEVKGCGSSSECIGLCSKHRGRWVACGRPDRAAWLAAGGPMKKYWDGGRKVRRKSDH